MVRVKLVEIAEHLRPQMTAALSVAVKQTIPRAFFESGDLYALFIESLAHECNAWEDIPDHLIRVS